MTAERVRDPIPGERWITKEEAPRLLKVVGQSMVDPDCFVAYMEGQQECVWIVMPSGCVVGLDGNPMSCVSKVHAHPEVWGHYHVSRNHPWVTV